MKTPEIQLFTTLCGEKLLALKPLTPEGSNRQYFRITLEQGTLIGVKGTSRKENEAFIMLSNHFKKQGLAVPQVLAVSEDRMSYIQEDLGPSALFSLMERGRTSGRYSAAEVALLSATMKALPPLQYQGIEDIEFSSCYPQSCFDDRMVRFDLNYFKYNFLKFLPLEFDEALLENDFDTLRKTLLDEPMDCFMYRDFQSRNVMIKDNKPFFIDFQGGRKGCMYYDVASFLWQAKAQYPPELRRTLIRDYIQALKPYKTLEEDEFMRHLRPFVLFRLIQVLGAYGYRGLYERKVHFLTSIPFALKQLKALSPEDLKDYPYFSSLFKDIVALDFEALLSSRQDALAPMTSGACAKDTAPQKVKPKPVLNIEIWSFGYKNGLPYDRSGNGGGYLFDCRAMLNPGRFEAFKQLTGMDPAVQEFLDDKGEIQTFLSQVFPLIDRHVECYQTRGFQALFVGFGCTGGQHRSVYCAELLAQHLASKYDHISIEIHHREQQIIKKVL